MKLPERWEFDMGRPPGIEYKLMRLIDTDGTDADSNTEEVFFGYSVDPDSITPRDFGLELIHIDDRLDQRHDTVYLLQLASGDSWVTTKRFRMPGRLPLPARMSAKQLQFELASISSAS